MVRDLSFKQARLGFRFSNETQNLSKRTVKFYDDYVDAFERFMNERHSDRGGEVRLSDTTTDDVREFIAHLQARTTRYDTHVRRKPREGGLSPYTIRGYTRALSAFFSWAVREKLLDRSPSENVTWPKVPKEIKEIFTEDDIKKLLKACDEYPVALAARNKAIVKMLLDTGVRAAELSNLTLDRLDDKLQRVHVTGKGLKDRYVICSASTRDALWKYINIFRPKEHGVKTNRVFLTARGRPLDTETLGLILRRLGERAEVPHCHPHKFRHTALTLFYRYSHGNLFLTQQMAGHESPTTTRIYAKTYTEDLERVHEAASPVMNWDL